MQKNAPNSKLAFANQSFTRTFANWGIILSEVRACGRGELNVTQSPGPGVWPLIQSVQPWVQLGGTVGGGGVVVVGGSSVGSMADRKDTPRDTTL